MFLCILRHYRDEKQHIKVPTDIEDAKNLGKVLSLYKDKYYYQVLGGYFLTYILYPFHMWINFDSMDQYGIDQYGKRKDLLNFEHWWSLT